MARRALGTAAALSLSTAFWTPLVAAACGGGTGTAITGGGSQDNFFSSMDLRTFFLIVLAGFLFVLAQVAIAVMFAVRHGRRRAPVPVAQLSPDGMYWWDGRLWHPLRASG